MEYVIVLTKEAKIDLDKLDSVIVKRIGKKLLYLKKDPVGLSKSLVDFSRGAFRYRIWDFRVCFDIKEEKVVIHRIKHRREVYK